MRAGTDGAEERRMRVLARLGAEFGRIVSREELHRAIARLLRDEAGYDGVAIWRSEDGADALVLGASEGLAPAGPGFAGEAATQLIVPLVSHGQPIGALGVRTNDPCVLDEADALLLDSVAPAIAAACEVASLHETLREAALTDAPTGLPNARGFGHALAQEVARSRRHGYRFALALVAVDGTQALRELDGRLAGDAALRAVGAALRSHLRGADIVARYGSEDSCRSRRDRTRPARSSVHSARHRSRPRTA
jgi:GAF domain-containing protein